ncbi:MAG TPA: hypothetical protein VHV83_05450 [Armatimonadota bacterium]|nr:hypothetical protein [Armatimonadota bacterium]
MFNSMPLLKKYLVIPISALCLVWGLINQCHAQESVHNSPRKVGVAALAGQHPVRMIFDCDMDNDCDDAGAMAVLHTLADKHEVEILAVMISALDQYSGPCVDAINTY